MLAAIGMVFVASHGNTKIASRPNIEVITEKQISKLDDDNDGLKNWEEVIAGTDPKNPDSDGNGLPDSVDRASNLAFKNEILDNAGALPLPTAELSRSLSEYMQARVKKTGTLTKNDFNTSVQNAITNDVIAATERILDQKNPYTQKNIRIDESADPKTYFNAIGRVGEKYFPPTQESAKLFDNERAFLELTQKKHANGSPLNDEEYAKILNTAAGFRAKYAGFASEIKSVPVPPMLSEFHLSFINFLANTALAVHNISLLDTDPILGAIGMEHYIHLLREGAGILTQARDATKKYNITFTGEDSSYARRYFSKPTT